MFGVPIQLISIALSNVYNICCTLLILLKIFSAFDGKASSRWNPGLTLNTNVSVITLVAKGITQEANSPYPRF